MSMSSAWSAERTLKALNALWKNEDEDLPFRIATLECDIANILREARLSPVDKKGLQPKVIQWLKFRSWTADETKHPCEIEYLHNFCKD